jgi:protein-tyrosine kinase
MGFFYQALKKETGVASENPEEAGIAPAHERPAASNTATEVREPNSDRSYKRPVKKSFAVKHPLENLVAFLAPPVVDENIIAMEQCRVLRTRVREAMLAKKMRSILITSAMPAEGKTFLSVNLAFAMSHIENAKVLLVDADLRRPSVAHFLKMEAHSGLGSFLTGKHEFDEICFSITSSLDVVPTQQVDENSAELLHSKRMQEFLHTATERYDVILMDGPPLFPIVDAQVLAPLVDGAILVVRAGKTPFDLSRRAADLLKTKLIGSVLNGAEHMGHSSYYGGYYGGRYASKGKK